MPLHYFTLCRLTAEMQAHLSGAYLTDCFTQEKNVLVFEFERGKSVLYVECHLVHQTGGIFLRETYHRARKNSLDIFPELIGQKLQSVMVGENERLISMIFTGDVIVQIVPFGGKQAAGFEGAGNVFLTSTDGITHNSFKSVAELRNSPFFLRKPDYQTLLQLSGDTELLKALAQCHLLLGRFYAREALRRLNLEGMASVTLENVAQHRNLETIQTAGQNLRDECLGSEEVFVYRNLEGTLEFSLIPITILGEPVEQFRSVSAAIKFFRSLRHKEQTFFAQKASLLRKLEQKVKKTEKTLYHLTLETEKSEQVQQWQYWGDLLLGMPDLYHKGLEYSTVESWTGEHLTIPLNPALSVFENAQKYFAKARSAKESQTTRVARQDRYRAELEQLRHTIQEVANIEDPPKLRQCMEQHSFTENGANQHQHVATTRFRQFELGEGYTLYVGKTAADNDTLTVRFAKPHDYWFHARGVAGSHAVLKTPGGDKKPPRYIVEKAASIAAYFSKARNAGLLPVLYTQKKYVRKPKGAAVGAVIVEREDVVMVRPALPE